MMFRQSVKLTSKDVEAAATTRRRRM